MNLNKKIDFIYSNKEILSDVFHSNDTSYHNRVFFSKTKSYIGIEQKYNDITCKVIFINNGVWQYYYDNSQPNNQKYISLDAYLDILIKKIKAYKLYV
jgi:hypothetical protein